MNQKIKKKYLSVLALAIAALSYSLLNVAVRLLDQGLPNMTQVYLRVSLGFLLAVIVSNKKIKLNRLKNIPKQDWLWLLIMGTLGYSICVYFVTMASLNTKLVNVAVIFSTLPFIVYFYSYFLLNEKIKPLFILLLIVSAYGVSVVATKSFRPHLQHIGRGELYAFLSAVFAGWWSVGRKKLSKKLNFVYFSRKFCLW